MTAIPLILVATLAATNGTPRAFAADGALLAIEDEWRRVATSSIREEARSQGIIVAGDAAVALVPDGGGTLGSAPADGGSYVLYLSRPGHGLKAGVYQAVVDSAGIARLLYFNREVGRARIGLRVPPGDPAALHTPLGDDLCENAPDLIMSYCQVFVACAAYGFFC
jgi:hypothetical protein